VNDVARQGDRATTTRKTTILSRTERREVELSIKREKSRVLEGIELVAAHTAFSTRVQL
jgi:hypothetical protein